jgi:hypothetical protein
MRNTQRISRGQIKINNKNHKMKTSELRSIINRMNLNGLVSLSFSRKNNDNKNHFVVIGNQELAFETSKEQDRVFKMLVGRFGFEKYSNSVPFISEEERGYFEGWAADMANPAQHGRTISTSITSEGTGQHIVWDYYQHKSVEKQYLSNIDKINKKAISN